MSLPSGESKAENKIVLEIIGPAGVKESLRSAKRTPSRTATVSLLVLGALVPFLVPRNAAAQLAPSGAHYAGRASDTGFAGPTGGGGFGASVAMDFPPSRAGLPIPVQIVSGARGFGAAGVGWDVPLFSVQFEISIAHRRPAYAPGEAPDARTRVAVMLPGKGMVELLPRGAEWVGRFDPLVEMRRDTGQYIVTDGSGMTYTFGVRGGALENPLLNTGLFLLYSIKGPGNASVELNYDIKSDPERGGLLFGPFSVDLVSVNYNPEIDIGIFDDLSGEVIDGRTFAAWRNASLSVRVDAVIAHEWEEFIGPFFGNAAHQAALLSAPNSALPISDAARDLLTQMRIWQTGQ